MTDAMEFQFRKKRESSRKRNEANMGVEETQERQRLPDMKTKGAKNLLNACSHSETLSENQIYKVISISCWLIQLS